MTLEQLIDQQYALGHKDPHEFPSLLERALGDDLVNITKPYIADFVTDMARQRINTKRRSSVAKITSKNATDPNTKLHSLWVPSSGSITYKRIADMTAQDFDARAAYLERMAHGIHRHAQWCRDCAQSIRSNNVKTAGKLANLPPLPETDG